MQPIDFSQLLNQRFAQEVMPPEAAPADGVYRNNDGIQFRSRDRNGGLVQDIVRLGRGALLFASDYSNGDAQLHHQSVTDSDWVHIQFRINGGGCEWVSGT